MISLTVRYKMLNIIIMKFKTPFRVKSKTNIYTIVFFPKVCQTEAQALIHYKTIP